MNTALGIDLGTSAAKVVLVDGAGRACAAASADYPIDEPRPGWAEQDPDHWWAAVCRAVQVLREQPDGALLLASVQAIGLSGQMHGTVVLDRLGHPLRPAIIWADARSTAEAATLNAAFERHGLSQRVGGRIASGFMAATLAWLRHHEPQTWASMASCVLPKDALRLRLTGGPPLTEASDASSTLLLDLRSRDWSPEALDIVGLLPGILPPVYEAGSIVGHLSHEAAAALGFRAGLPVIAGGSDQGMAAVGAGILDPGDLLISVSTGGQLVAPLARPDVDPQLRAFTMCHVLPDRSFCLAATLSAGLALRWLRRNVLGNPSDEAFEVLVAQAADVPPGADDLLFLPYLLGERAPHLGRHARGVFCGLALRHNQAHLLRAVLEGVAYSLRDTLDVVLAVGVQPQRIVVAGGGMRLPVWRHILAGVLGRHLLPLAVPDQSALGAALVAGASTGLFPDVPAACRLAVAYDDPVIPQTSAMARYEHDFPLYKSLYPAVQPTLLALADEQHDPAS